MSLGTLWQHVKRNHALEHATIALLVERGIKGAVAGNATTGGFLIYGDLPTDQLTQTVAEALGRLQQGERHLAISRFCGTNLVVGALLAGAGSLLALGRQDRWRRMPLVLGTTLGSILAARPLGALMQRYVTTDTDLAFLIVTGVTSRGVGPYTVHHVATRQP